MALTANPLHFSGQFCVECFRQIAKSPCLGMLLTTVCQAAQSAVLTASWNSTSTSASRGRSQEQLSRKNAKKSLCFSQGRGSPLFSLLFIIVVTFLSAPTRGSAHGWHDMFHWHGSGEFGQRAAYHCLISLQPVNVCEYGKWNSSTKLCWFAPRPAFVTMLIETSTYIFILII